MTKKALLKRKINGKNYYGGPWFDTKTEAKAWANKIRKKGFRAVVVASPYRGKKGYRVLDRSGFMK